MIDPIVKVVIDGLSDLILRSANAQGSEERTPTYSADESGEVIKTLRKRVSELRAIRERFEDITSDRIVPDVDVDFARKIIEAASRVRMAGEAGKIP